MAVAALCPSLPLVYNRESRGLLIALPWPPIAHSMFFSFDGIDGVGKSTQMQLFQEWLRDAGHEVVTCRDPGSTAVGERIREIVLTSDESTPIVARCEMLLYMA